jgi:hypothetical protein
LAREALVSCRGAAVEVGVGVAVEVGVAVDAVED